MTQLPSPNRSKTTLRVYILAADNMTGELLTSVFSRGKNAFLIHTLTGTAQSILSRLGESKPNVILITEELQDGPEAGFEVLRSVRNSHPETVPVMLLKSSTPDRVVQAFREGARGIVYRSHSLKALSKCIRTVHEGQIWAANQDLEHVLSALTPAKPLQFCGADGTPLLTRREEEVVRLVVDGMKNRDVAQRLQVTEHSVRNYVYRIFEKLGVSTRVELILYVLSRGRPSAWPQSADSDGSALRGAPVPMARRAPIRERHFTLHTTG